jgi:hypothetical protein
MKKTAHYAMVELLICECNFQEIPSGPENLTHADKEVETVIFNAFVFCQVSHNSNA